jgi:uncharacterized protein YhjY with autotransporter beta-barrel domain
LLGLAITITLSLLVPRMVSAQAAAPTVPSNPSAVPYFQAACTALTAASNGGTLTAAQRDLLASCPFLQSGKGLSAPGYAALAGQPINALGPQTKKFGSLQQDNLSARLAELRHGATGISVAGLNFDDSAGSVGLVADSNNLTPGSGSGDGNGNGEWLDGRLGVFVNGSLQSGSKRRTRNSFAFNITDDSLTMGADYRLTSNFVIGAAYGTGLTSAAFGSSLGRLDLRAQGVNLYASLYGQSYYLDFLGGYGVPRLNTQREINYTDSVTGTNVNQEARGSTHLHELWAGMSAGRPFNWGAFGLTPEGSLNFHEVRLSKFSESMSNPDAAGAGLGLTYGDAVVPSLQARAGLKATYTLSSSWGVFQPNLHAAWIREFRNHPDFFSAQLENTVAGETDAMIIKTDAPEGHYTAYGGGLLFQLAHAISGYVDYEELRTLKSIKSHEFTLGLRYQIGS